jgi:acyl dehydratase
VIWFGSKTLFHDVEWSRPLEINDSIAVKASVKAHNEREGVKQTIVTRVAEHFPKAKTPRAKKTETPVIA